MTKKNKDILLIVVALLLIISTVSSVLFYINLTTKREPEIKFKEINDDQSSIVLKIPEEWSYNNNYVASENNGSTSNIIIKSKDQSFTLKISLSKYSDRNLDGCFTGGCDPISSTEIDTSNLVEVGTFDNIKIGRVKNFQYSQFEFNNSPFNAVLLGKISSINNDKYIISNSFSSTNYDKIIILYETDKDIEINSIPNSFTTNLSLADKIISSMKVR